MASIPDTIRAMGGIAARRELLRKGHRADWIEIFWRGGRIERIRNGWYANPEVDVEVKRAWRVGGRLGCISAAHHHGLAPPDPRYLHVNVVRRSARLRQPDDKRQRLATAPVDGLIIHWVDGLSMQETWYPLRQAVPGEDALAQMASCEAAWLARQMPLGSATDSL
jgi:hypothetical protein